MTKRRFALSSAVLISGLVACGGSDGDGVVGPPADVSGNYRIAVKNTDNGCGYANWEIGKTAENIELEVTQTDATAKGQVKGLANFYFALLGIGALEGNVSGSSASLTAVGTNSVKQGQCAYFVRATADFTLTGNTINGTMTYRNETNHHADCGVLETCTSQQSVAGSRPPK